jgi:hypothetical protein
MKKIVILIPYFGEWPDWFELYLLSCKWNETVDWIFFTDCREPELKLPNVHYVKIGFADYCKLVSSQLSIDFKPQSAYKLCDVKPFYGFIHQEEIAGYDYFGFGDIDVIYGNLRKFLTPPILQHNLISTHYNRISGHLCLLKNTEQMRNAYSRIVKWESLLENPDHLGIDESKFTKVFLRHRKHPTLLLKLAGLFDPYQRNNYWREQYSTILSPYKWHDGTMVHPETWKWKNGRLTNQRDGRREFMYLHFMNWKSSRWLPKELRKKGVLSAWEDQSQIIHLTTQQAEKGFMIDRKGFHPL